MSFTELAVMVLQDDVDYTVLLNILKEKLKRKPFEGLEAYVYHLISIPPSHLIVIFPYHRFKLLLIDKLNRMLLVY